MNFVRVGNRFINLDLVTDVRHYPSRQFKGEDHDEPVMTEETCRIGFAVPEGGTEGEESNQWDLSRRELELKGHEASDFVAWLDDQSSDAAGWSMATKEPDAPAVPSV